MKKKKKGTKEPRSLTWYEAVVGIVCLLALVKAVVDWVR